MHILAAVVLTAHVVTVLVILKPDSTLNVEIGNCYAVFYVIRLLLFSFNSTLSYVNIIIVHGPNLVFCLFGRARAGPILTSLRGQLQNQGYLQEVYCNTATIILHTTPQHQRSLFYTVCALGCCNTYCNLSGNNVDFITGQ